MFKVYHVKNEVFGNDPSSHEFPQDFDHVANVDTVSIDEVFGLTNHINTVWFDNERVEVIKRGRSTSVGDVVVDENGTAHRCEMQGWTEL